MSQITNIIEPTKLYVSWQQPTGTGTGHSRTRHVIGLLYKDSNNYEYFKYLAATEEFNRALSLGFTGHPSFKIPKITEHPYANNVTDPFIKRLPTRKRSDFSDFLIEHGLPVNFTGSDFSLLAHTGAQLPSDGFEIFPDLTDVEPPYQFFMNVAGSRYLDISYEDIRINSDIIFEYDNNNVYDINAIKILCGNQHIGFVPKPLQTNLRYLIDNERVSANIEICESTTETKLIKLFVIVN